MIRKITTFTSAYIQIQTFTLTQLYNAVSTVIRDDLWVWRKEICPEMNCFVSLPYAGAVHDVKNHTLAIFALWLCIRMCRVIPSADPAHFFSPRPHTVHVYWCVVAASAGFFSFFIQTGMTNTDNSVCAACFSLAFFLLHLKELVAHMQFPHVFFGLMCVNYCRYAWAQKHIHLNLMFLYSPNMSLCLTLTFTGRSNSASFSCSQFGTRSCRTRPLRTVCACSHMLPYS